MVVHLGTCHHLNDTANFGFLRPDTPLVEGIDRDLFVGRRAWRRPEATRVKVLDPMAEAA